MKVSIVGQDSGRVEISGIGDVPVWFEGDELSSTGDAAMCAALLPAMAIGERLELQDPITPGMSENVVFLQSVFSTWFPSLSPVEVIADIKLPSELDGPRQESLAEHQRSALFFTGGVDSFHALQLCASENPSLLFVHGFDVPLSEPELATEVQNCVVEVSSARGLNHRFVSTNLREVIDPIVNWPMFHGAGLATVAHVAGYRRAIIASSASYGELYPWGSHPLTDPRWGGDCLEILHVGAESTRLRKLAEIKSDPGVQRHLRVCYQAKGYNCGRCEKCIRTRVALVALGVAREFDVFPGRLTMSDIVRADLRTEASRRHVRANRSLLRMTGSNRALIAALTIQLGASQVRPASRQVRSRARKIRSILP